MKEEYNWWEDPKNTEEVKKISWWNHPENQTTISIPIAIVKSENNYVASLNDKDNKYFGEHVHGCVSGKTEEETKEKLLQLARFLIEFYRDRELSYQRWVPFRKGPWSKTGGNWFAIFGFHVYFRTSKSHMKHLMKYGWFIPFTNLNISFSSDWTIYKKYKQKQNESRGIHRNEEQ